MIRTTSTLIAAALVCAAAYAQAPAPQPAPPQKPRPGSIIDTPSSGRITDAPTAPKPAAPAPRTPSTGAVPANLAALAGLPVERFEASGNTSVASDTIRVYLGIAPGEIFDPVALQRNFLNLWQTGLFDDIRLEADKGETGVIVRDPSGSYAEVHRAISQDEAFTLTSRVEPLALEALTSEDDLAAKNARMEQLRRRASRFYFIDNLRKPTRAELEEAAAHLAHHGVGNGDGDGHAVGHGNGHHEITSGDATSKASGH